MTTTRQRSSSSLAARIAVGLGAIVLGLGAAGAASAGPPDPTATASFDCRDGQGYIEVTIEDYQDSERTFHIDIGEDQVGNSVLPGVYEYGPYATGGYAVEVFWTNGETVIYSDTLTFVCVADTVPESGPDTTDVGSGGGTIPDAGQGSFTLLVTAGLLLASGVALVAVRRRATPA